jgi:hypothetical protein
MLQFTRPTAQAALSEYSYQPRQFSFAPVGASTGVVDVDDDDDDDADIVVCRGHTLS